MQVACFIPYFAYMHNYTEWAMKKYPAFRFARVLAIFSLALVCKLCRVFDQLVNCRAVTIPQPPSSLAVLDRMLLALTHQSN
jgi:hypothetical protein